MDTAHGADAPTGTATRAQVVVDGREVVLHVNGSHRAGALTLATADTADVAVFARQGAFVMV